MSFDSSAPMFKLNFTDGTFITILNTSLNAETYSENQDLTFVLPNFYLGDFDDWNGSVVKYDKNGNKYEFSNRGMILNDTVSFQHTGARMRIGFNPDTGHFAFATVNPIPEFIPVVNVTYNSVDATVYDGYTGNSMYPSVGSLIAEGERHIAEYEYSYMRIGNILPRNTPTGFHSLNIFGYQNYAHRLDSYLPENQATSASFDIPGYEDLLEDFEPVITPTDDEDPYDPGGDSGEGGGTGDFDGTGDDIDFPSLPTLSATDTGFITIFNPSLAQLKNLASYMWSSLDLNAFRKLFADPMDCILGLSIVPVAVPNGSTQAVKVGNISTGVSMTVAASQYVEVDCGSLNVNEYWGAYLDYDPYTKAEIYLPYIGTHPVAVDDIMKKNVSVKYHVDILSGACTAYVKCGGSVLYEFIGQCSSSIPITGNDWTNVINGVLSIAGSIGTMVATGGLSAPVSAGSIAGALAGAGTIASTAINTMKPSVEKSGAMAGTGGMLAVQTPYLILTRPRQALPAGQNSFMGYPSFINEYLGSLSGYTEVERVHLSGIPGTDAELQEIENLLMKGVIF